MQALKTNTHGCLVFSRDRSIALHLPSAERVQCLLQIRGGVRNPFQRIVEVDLVRERVLDVFVRGKADKGIPGTDIEVDVRQWLDAEVVVRPGPASTCAASLRKRRSLQISTASSMMSTPKRLLRMMLLKMK